MTSLIVLLMLGSPAEPGSLLRALDSPRYREREAAGWRAMWLPEANARAVLALGRRVGPPESRQRLRPLRDRLAALDRGRALRRLDGHFQVYPCADAFWYFPENGCFNPNGGSVERTAFVQTLMAYTERERHKGLKDLGGTFDACSRRATREFLCDRLLAGESSLGLEVLWVHLWHQEYLYARQVNRPLPEGAPFQAPFAVNQLPGRFGNLAWWLELRQRKGWDGVFR